MNASEDATPIRIFLSLLLSHLFPRMYIALLSYSKELLFFYSVCLIITPELPPNLTFKVSVGLGLSRDYFTSIRSVGTENIRSDWHLMIFSFDFRS